MAGLPMTVRTQASFICRAQRAGGIRPTAVPRPGQSIDRMGVFAVSQVSQMKLKRRRHGGPHFTPG